KFEVNLQIIDEQVLSDNSKNSELILELKNWAKTHGDTLDRLKVKLREAYCLAQNGNKIDALSLATQVQKSLESNDQLRFSSSIFLRNIYQKLGAFDIAMEIHTHLNWEHASPRYWEAFVPNNFLAFNHFKLGETDAAIKIMRENIALVEESNMHYWQL